MLTEEYSFVNGKSPRIMVVDDNPSNIKLIARILKTQGYDNIKAVSDSSLVMDEYKSWQPNIILLDLLMPKFNGLDILDQINSIRNKQYLPVIMITADRCGADDTKGALYRSFEQASYLKAA